MASILRENQKSLKEFHINDYNCSEEDAIALIQCTQVESLCFILNSENISKQTFNMITQSKHLETLHLITYFGSSTNIQVQDLANVLCQPNLSQLTSLRLSCPKRIFHNELLTAIASLMNLKDLCLDQNLYLYEETYEDLGTILRNCKKLEKIVLHVKFKFHEIGFKNLWQLELPCLKVVGIHCYSGLKLDPKFVVNCLKKSKSIKLLCFDKVKYYRDKKANNKLFSFYEYEEFHDKFPEAVLELNNAFRFTRYHSQGLRPCVPIESCRYNR